MNFDDIVTFHGHACPGLAMGYRASILAIRELTLDHSRDEEVVAVVENKSCAVDAIQMMTGCTFGKGNLIFKDYGKQVYTFMKRPGGEAVRVAVTWSPPQGKKEAVMWKRYMADDRSQNVLEAVKILKAAKRKAILAAKEGELFTFKKMVIPLPAKARIYPSINCSACNEKVMEPKAVIINNSVYCKPCAAQ